MTTWTTVCWTVFFMYSVALTGCLVAWVMSALWARHEDPVRQTWPLPTKNTLL